MKSSPCSSNATPRAFPTVFALTAVLALVPLWSVVHPPMADLPQHAAQVYVALHHADAQHPELAAAYELRFLTPYILGYLVTGLFALLMPVPAAIQVVVTLAVLGVPLALAVLLRRVGADPWWSLLGFPLAFGFSFYWGFFNYLVALPLGLAFVSAGVAYAREPTRRGSIVLVLFAGVLYLAHALVFAFVVPWTGLLILVLTMQERPSEGATWRYVAVRLLPLALPALALALWVVLTEGDSLPPVWGPGPWERLAFLPALLTASDKVDGGVWSAAGLAVLVIPLFGGRLRFKPAWLALPLVSAFAVFLVLPHGLFEAWYVYERFAFFVAVAVLLLSAPAPSIRRRRLGRGLAAALAFAWMAWLTWSFQEVDRENRRLAALLEPLPDGKSLLGLNFDPGVGNLVGLPVFFQSHMWYQATHGGIAEVSFASQPFPHILARYREGAGPRARNLLDFQPFLFDPAVDGPFDYYLVRVDQDIGGRLFRGLAVDLVAQDGRWWLYRPARRPEESRP